jgi:hypothetical protein
VHEDDDLASLVPLPKHFQQTQEAVSLGPDLHKLCDVAVDHAATTNLQAPA